MLRTHLVLLGLLLAACSGPTSVPAAYPQNPAVSDAQGHPQDSTTFYFPAADSLHDRYIPEEKRTDTIVYANDIRFADCAYELKYVSYALSYFEAPVLSNYYLGVDAIRFIWLRSFHRPVLLTLSRDAAGASLRTQLLDKWPGFAEDPLMHPDSLSPDRAAKQKARYMEFYQQEVNSPRHLAQVAEGKRRAALVTAEETTVAISPEQWQHLQALLRQTQFWQLPACRPRPGMLDGAYWLLETHQASGYHMVFRHSPEKPDGFRKACEYLIELSSVRGEERY